MSGQNRSAAVMQQRIEPHDSLDDFPTQPWATRALIENIIAPWCGRENLRERTAWDPCANRGHMVDPMREYFGEVHGSDIFDYGAGFALADFLIPGLEPDVIAEYGVDWIFMNPPFRLAEEFIERATGLANIGVAVIARTSFLEGGGRHHRLFATRPPSIIAQHVERVPMVKGRLTANGSTATSYCWLIWSKFIPPQPFRWIPACRKRLERAEDYAAYPELRIDGKWMDAR